MVSPWRRRHFSRFRGQNWGRRARWKPVTSPGAAKPRSRCGRALGFLPDLKELTTLESSPDGSWQVLTPAAQGRLCHPCRNGEQHQVCNWLVRAEDPNPFCVACRLNDLIPDLNVWGNRERWRRLEAAKRRIVYTLLRLGLPMDGVPAENRPALRFRNAPSCAVKNLVQ